jgi:hypothetical protein
MKTYRNTLRIRGDDAGMECASKEVITTTVEIISLKQKFIIGLWFSRFCPVRWTWASLPLWAFAWYLFGMSLLSARARVHIHAGQDDLEDEMGFRTVEVRGTQILLNGSPLFLRGVCVHAEAPYRTGRANNDEDMNTLLGWVHELGTSVGMSTHRRTPTRPSGRLLTISR